MKTRLIRLLMRLMYCCLLLSGCTASANDSISPTQPLPQTSLTAPASNAPTNAPNARSANATASATVTTPPGNLPTQEAYPSPSASAEGHPTAGPTATLAPKAWRYTPIIPTTVSQQMHEVYALGQSLGNNPHAFSKVGDCQSMMPDFMGGFDSGRYNLGEYTSLQPVIDTFAGSFGRYSRASKTGMTASAVLATLWNDWRDCGTTETPLECEYRLHQPSYAFISLGTNDANGFLPFEDTLRRVIELTLEHGIVPILVTKADNAEGDWSINATIVRLAYEYEIPLWNFWLAVQPLPQQGLRSPEHLTMGEYVLTTDFSNLENMQYAFNVRNLNALQVLDVVWRDITNQPTDETIPTIQP
ncbi:MAG: hypothetical protein JW726_19745 [Anaerolineales bacterium]|nr:hypothetical protein [Anaerolineales bacterium]